MTDLHATSTEMISVITSIMTEAAEHHRNGDPGRCIALYTGAITDALELVVRLQRRVFELEQELRAAGREPP